MLLRKSLLLLAASILIFAGCSDDDEATSYDQTEFYGTWELENSTSEDYVACPDNPPTLVVNASEISFPATTSDGCEIGSTDLQYAFNGSVFTVSIFGTEVKYTVTAKSENEFSWEDNFEGNQETWVKVN